MNSFGVTTLKLSNLSSFCTVYSMFPPEWRLTFPPFPKSVPSKLHSSADLHGYLDPLFSSLSNQLGLGRSATGTEPETVVLYAVGAVLIKKQLALLVNTQQSLCYLSLANALFSILLTKSRVRSISRAVSSRFWCFRILGRIEQRVLGVQIPLAK